MVVETTAAASFGSYNEGDESFLRRAGTVAQRRHTRKTTQLAADVAAMSLMMTKENPLPATPISPSSSASDVDTPGYASSIDLARSPTSSITTAECNSLDSVTSKSFDMDNFTLPPLPQPHVPLRKTSASNLRQIAVSKSHDRYSGIVDSPTISQFPERRSSRIKSPRRLFHRPTPSTSRENVVLEDEAQIDATIAKAQETRDGASPRQSHFLEKDFRLGHPRVPLAETHDSMPAESKMVVVEEKENVVQIGPVPPRGRARGMTTVGQRPQGDSSLQFRSPSIPDMRGDTRAHMSSTYKPERGPGNRDPGLVMGLGIKNPPPVPWKQDEEVRDSFRSGVTNTTYATNTSSVYYEPSEAGRSSVATRSSKYSNYSQQQRINAADEDDFDACDYIDLYAGGFVDDSPQRSARTSLQNVPTRTNSIQAGRLSLRDPAIQSPLSPYDEPRPSSVQLARSPALSNDSRPSSIQEPLTHTEQNNAPTKCDSKFDDADFVVPKLQPLPQSPAILQSSPNSPALMSHPVNPAAPPSPDSPFPPSLKSGDVYASQPVSPLSRMDISPLGAPAYQPSPLDGEMQAFFPPVKPVTTATTTSSSPFSHGASLVALEGSVPRDRYGFKKASINVTVEQYDAWNEGYTSYLQRRQTKWEIMLIQWGFPIKNPTRFPPRSDKVKRYIRKGIPPNWRGACWFHYAGGPQRLAANPGLYARRLREADDGKLSDVDRDSIEKDLARTFPDHIEFKADPIPNEEPPEVPIEVPIIKALRRVLQAFAVDNPSIGYCQSLNFLAGLMLLFLKDEEKAFHLLNILCNVHMPGIHAKILESNVDIGVLLSCIRDSLPQIWTKIDDTNEGSRALISTMRLPTVSLVITPWFMSCFVGCLPTESVLRVWDAFFYEGSKTIFRLGLAIFKTGAADIMRVDESLETLQVVQGIPRKILDINALMESCYKRRNGFGHLSQDVIDSRRKERRTALQKERDFKNGQMSPHILQDMAPPPSRGRQGTLSRAASKARGFSRARSRKRTDVLPDDEVPPTPPMSRQGTGTKF